MFPTTTASLCTLSVLYPQMLPSLAPFVAELVLWVNIYLLLVISTTLCLYPTVDAALASWLPSINCNHLIPPSFRRDAAEYLVFVWLW